MQIDARTHSLCTTLGERPQTTGQTLVVAGNRHVTIRGDELVTHEGARTTAIHGEHSLNVHALSSAMYHDSLERRIFGRDETTVYAPQSGGFAHSRTKVEGELELEVQTEAKLVAGDRFELVQGSPAAQAQVVLTEGDLGLDAEKSWRGTAGSSASLTAATSLALQAAVLTELSQGDATITLFNEEIVMNARAVRIIVGDNQLVMSEAGLSIEAKSININGAELPIHPQSNSTTKSSNVI
jgi:hypothetical protein